MKEVPKYYIELQKKKIFNFKTIEIAIYQSKNIIPFPFYKSISKIIKITI